MCLFSVIIPTYNRERLVVETLDSVLAQECQDFEIIVVDDGSTDTTVDVVRSYQARTARPLHVLQQSNSGPAAARNLGIARASGRYTAFLDSDDLWFPWTLRTFAQVISEHGEPAFVAGQGVRFRELGELEGTAQQALEVTAYRDYYASWRESLWIGMGSVAIRTTELRAAGGLVQRWINAEDTDLWLRLGVAKGFVHVRSPVLFAYRQAADTQVSNLQRSIDGMRYLISQERGGVYPGGRERSAERLTILTSHLRSWSLACLAGNRPAEAAELYRASFTWNARLGRWRFLLGFAAAYVKSLLRRSLAGKRPAGSDAEHCRIRG